MGSRSWGVKNNARTNETNGLIIKIVNSKPVIFDPLSVAVSRQQLSHDGKVDRWVFNRALASRRRLDQ